MPERRRGRLALAAAALVAGAAASAAAADPQDFAQIERGRYLTAVADCAACHTLPGSGRDFAG